MFPKIKENPEFRSKSDNFWILWKEFYDVMLTQFEKLFKTE